MFYKMFLDTNIFVYYLEECEPYYSKIKTALLRCNDDDTILCTSVITDAEFLVKPYRDGDITKANRYFDCLEELGIEKYLITSNAADTSAKIRTEYPTIKLADALQVATALTCGCDAFLTNDKQLKQIEEINILTLEEV